MPEKHEKDINDNILFEDFQRGKYYLFEYFFDKYYPGLCVYACRMIQSKSTAEDLVQDFFIKLWEDKNSLDIHGNVRSYFLRSVHNRCLNTLSRDSRRKAHLDYRQSRFQQDSVLQYPLLDVELESRLQKAIESLPDGIRETFIRNRLEGLTYQEIADRDGVTVKAIEYRISKALVLLRKDFQDYLPFALLLYTFR